MADQKTARFPKGMARQFIDTDFHYALGRVESVVALLPDTDLPVPPELESELTKARAALLAAQRIVTELADAEGEE